MSTPVRVIVNFISRDPKSFVEAATKVRKEGGIEILFCTTVIFTYPTILLQAVQLTRLEPGCDQSHLLSELGNTAEAGTTRSAPDGVVLSAQTSGALVQLPLVIE